MFAAEPPRLLRAAGSKAVVERLIATREALGHVLRTRIDAGPVMTGLPILLDHLNLDQGWLGHERFRVLHLDVSGRLICDDVTSVGSPTFVQVDTRAIPARAFEVGSSSIILVHNHPGGDPRPSAADIAKTRSIARGGVCADLHVVDHLIVAKGRHYSFREHGLL